MSEFMVDFNEGKSYSFEELAVENARLKKEVEELKEHKQEIEEGFKRIVADDRAKDEVHCGCCVELRLGIAKLEVENAVKDKALLEQMSLCQCRLEVKGCRVCEFDPCNIVTALGLKEGE